MQCCCVSTYRCHLHCDPPLRVLHRLLGDRCHVHCLAHIRLEHTQRRQVALEFSHGIMFLSSCLLTSSSAGERTDMLQGLSLTESLSSLANAQGFQFLLADRYRCFIKTLSDPNVLSCPVLSWMRLLRWPQVILGEELGRLEVLQGLLPHQSE